MDLYKELLNLVDQQLEELIARRIKELETKEEQIQLIGFPLEENPTEYYLTDMDPIHSFDLNIVCGYDGYIPRGTKIVYGFSYNPNNGVASNNGKYYYLDDDHYIYDFCQFIKNQEVANDYELFEYLLDFLKDYFKEIYTYNKFVIKSNDMN